MVDANLIANWILSSSVILFAIAILISIAGSILRTRRYAKGNPLMGIDTSHNIYSDIHVSSNIVPNSTLTINEQRAAISGLSDMSNMFRNCSFSVNTIDEAVRHARPGSTIYVTSSHTGPIVSEQVNTDKPATIFGRSIDDLSSEQVEKIADIIMAKPNVFSKRTGERKKRMIDGDKNE